MRTSVDRGQPRRGTTRCPHNWHRPILMPRTGPARWNGSRCGTTMCCGSAGTRRSRSSRNCSANRSPRISRRFSSRCSGRSSGCAALDRLVVSSPMWNWHVPHALKAWIDVIVQPVASFTLNERGEHVGTLGEENRCSSSSPAAAPTTGATPSCRISRSRILEYVFGMLGYRVDTLVVEPTTRWTAAEREQMRAEAVELAREVARTTGA